MLTAVLKLCGGCTSSLDFPWKYGVVVSGGSNLGFTDISPSDGGHRKVRETPFEKDLSQLQEEKALIMSFCCLGFGALGREDYWFYLIWGKKNFIR